MPIIQCDIREGRSGGKQAIAKMITRVVHETIGASVEYICVMIRKTPGSHHAKAGERSRATNPRALSKTN